MRRISTRNSYQIGEIFKALQTLEVESIMRQQLKLWPRDRKREPSEAF